MPAILRILGSGSEIGVVDLRTGPPQSREDGEPDCTHAIVSAVSSDAIAGQLDWAVPAGITAFVLSGTEGLRDVERLGAKLSVLEARHGLAAESLRILALAADTAAGTLALPSLRPRPRLVGIACDPARLAEALRCDLDAPAVLQARALTVLAAASCGVPAVIVASADLEGSAAREGFGALLIRS